MFRDVKLVVELLLFAVSWTVLAGIVFWLFSRLRGLRVLERRVYDLEDAVFGPEFDDEADCCALSDPEPEDVSVEVEDEKSDEQTGAADEPVEAAGQPQD